MLTFLAGAEIDPVSLRWHWKASVSTGVVPFLLPFVGALVFFYFVLGLDAGRSRDRRRSSEYHPRWPSCMPWWSRRGSIAKSSGS